MKTLAYIAFASSFTTFFVSVAEHEWHSAAGFFIAMTWSFLYAMDCA